MEEKTREISKMVIQAGVLSLVLLVMMSLGIAFGRELRVNSNEFYYGVVG